MKASSPCVHACIHSYKLDRLACSPVQLHVPASPMAVARVLSEISIKSSTYTWMGE